MNKYIVKFGAKWCSGCNIMEKNLRDANIPHISIDIDDEDGEILANRYAVKDLPCTFILRGEDEKDAINKADIVGRFEGVLFGDGLNILKDHGEIL